MDARPLYGGAYILEVGGHKEIVARSRPRPPSAAGDGNAPRTLLADPWTHIEDVVW